MWRLVFWWGQSCDGGQEEWELNEWKWQRRLTADGFSPLRLDGGMGLSGPRFSIDCAAKLHTFRISVDRDEPAQGRQGHHISPFKKLLSPSVGSLKQPYANTAPSNSRKIASFQPLLNNDGLIQEFYSFKNRRVESNFLVYSFGLWFGDCKRIDRLQLLYKY